MKHLSLLVLLAAGLMPSNGISAKEAGFVADFEQSDYAGWRAAGTAFGESPRKASEKPDHKIAGVHGRGFASSRHPDESAVGSLTSPEFVIDSDYLVFLMGGKGDAEKVGVELLIDGAPARRATVNQQEALDWVIWDLRELEGKSASVHAYDKGKAGDEFLYIDQVVMADNPTTASADLDAYRNSQDYYRETHRPQLHFTPEIHWMNDPNGLVYYDDEYHLFYQHNPFANAWGHMSWGHAVSKDLLHWQHLPIAIVEEDGTAIFSGSAVVDWKNSSGLGKNGKPPLIAIYTAHRPGNQSQAIAYSNDSGRTWQKYSDNPVLDINESDFRDPKVFWHEPTQRWVMVVSLALKHRIQFYSSTDLKNWEYMSDFYTADIPEVPNFECPDLFELPVAGTDGQTRWVLQISVGGNAIAGGSGSFYFVGDFDGRQFTLDESQPSLNWTDFGRDFYAANSWNDVPKSDGRHLWIGWMNNWETSLQPTTPWRSAMTIPRSLSLRKVGDRLRMVQEPIEELKNLRTGHKHITDVPVTNEIVIQLDKNESIAGKEPLEILAEIDPQGAREVGIDVHSGGEHFTRIGFSVDRKELFVDRTQSGIVDFHPVFAGVHGGEMTLLENGRIRVHAFVDRSSIEVFGNDGEVVITSSIFPVRSPENIRIYANGGDAKLISLDLWNLKSVWHGD